MGKEKYSGKDADIRGAKAAYTNRFGKKPTPDGPPRVLDTPREKPINTATFHRSYRTHLQGPSLIIDDANPVFGDCLDRISSMRPDVQQPLMRTMQGNELRRWVAALTSPKGLLPARFSGQLFKEASTQHRKLSKQDNEIIFSPRELKSLLRTSQTLQKGNIFPIPDVIVFQVNNAVAEVSEITDYSFGPIGTETRRRIEYFMSGSLFQDLFIKRSDNWQEFAIDLIREKSSNHEPIKGFRIPKKITYTHGVPEDYKYEDFIPEDIKHVFFKTPFIRDHIFALTTKLSQLGNK